MTRVRTDMGVRIEMSGQGCRAFETYSVLSWVQLLQTINNLPNKTKFTRIDLAYDDHEGVLDLDRIRDDALDRNYTSPMRKGSLISSWDEDTGILGMTAYIGSKKNDVFLRIYNKAAEREFTDQERHWVRVELCIKHDRAAVCCALIAGMESVGSVFSGVLRNYCLFRIPSSDSNKSRWPIADYWAALLDDTEKISLWLAPGEPYNALKVREQLVIQYGPTILALERVAGSGGIYGLIRDARKRYPGKLPKKYEIWIADELKKLEDLKQHRRNLLDGTYGFLVDAGWLTEDQLDEYIQDLL